MESNISLIWAGVLTSPAGEDRGWEETSASMAITRYTSFSTMRSFCKSPVAHQETGLAAGWGARRRCTRGPRLTRFQVGSA